MNTNGSTGEKTVYLFFENKDQFGIITTLRQFILMEIAKGVLAEDYLNLDLTNKSSADWDLAFQYLKLRLTYRFIEPADKLIDLEKDMWVGDKKYGFAILAIDCMLLETIQSFYEGVTNSHKKSRKLFTDFLRQRDSFKSHFTDDKGVIHIYAACATRHVWQRTIS